MSISAAVCDRAHDRDPSLGSPTRAGVEPAGSRVSNPAAASASASSSLSRPLKVLFFVEGFTDIRFVTGLSQICQLTLAVPARQYAESGLKQRVADSGAKLTVHEIPGSRLAFQARSLAYLWRQARNFDVILSQEVLRGSFNANLIGWFRGVPVVTYMGIAPVEYFRCRRERGRMGPVTALA